MTEKELNEYKARLEARHRKYEGFGETHSNAEWARRFNLPRNVLWRYLARGLTIEEVAKLRGVTYP